MGHPRPIFSLFSDFFKQTSKEFSLVNVHQLYGDGNLTHNLQFGSLHPMTTTPGLPSITLCRHVNFIKGVLCGAFSSKVFMTFNGTTRATTSLRRFVVTLEGVSCDDVAGREGNVDYKKSVTSTTSTIKSLTL